MQGVAPLVLPGHCAICAKQSIRTEEAFHTAISIDLIELRLKEGISLAEAAVVGSAVILFDPIFQGLAIALMAGEIASLALSRMTAPIVYYIVNRRRQVEHSPVNRGVAGSSPA